MKPIVIKGLGVLVLVLFVSFAVLMARLLGSWADGLQVLAAFVMAIIATYYINLTKAKILQHLAEYEQFVRNDLEAQREKLIQKEFNDLLIEHATQSALESTVSNFGKVWYAALGSLSVAVLIGSWKVLEAILGLHGFLPLLFLSGVYLVIGLCSYFLASSWPRSLWLPPVLARKEYAANLLKHYADSKKKET